MSRYQTMEASVKFERKFWELSDATAFVELLKKNDFEFEGIEPEHDQFVVRMSIVGTVQWERPKEW